MRTRQFKQIVVISLLFISAPAFAQSIIWDNGYTDGVGGVSNRSKPYRSLLDDFVVPEGQVWQLTGLQTWGVWLDADPPAGESFELTIWSHVEDHPDFPGYPGPDQPLTEMIVTGYEEQITGPTWFGREEVSLSVEIDPHELEAGTYWLEMHILAQDLTEGFIQMERSEIIENSYWVDYEDFGGLRPSEIQFGSARDLGWNLSGEVFKKCPADFDDDGTVGVSDLLALLGAWGACANQNGCPEDLDDNSVVGLSDLLALLANWGPCP